MTPITRLAPLALLPLLAGCPQLLALVDKPQVSLQSVDVASADFEAVKLNFHLKVDNPNPFSVPVARLAYQLDVDGHPLAQGRVEPATSLPAGGSTEIVLPATFRYTDLGATVESILQKDQLPYVAHLTVGFDAAGGSFDVPIEHSGTIPVPRLPDVALSDVSVGSVGLDGVTLNLALSLHNGNSYELPVSTVSWRASVDGNQVGSGALPPTSLPPQATRVVPLSFKLSLLGGGYSVVEAVRAGRAHVALDGTVGIRGYDLPLHVERDLQ